MSLGITSVWRARPLRLGPAIHRKPLFAQPRSTPLLFATRLGYSIVTQKIEGAKKGISDDSNHVREPGPSKFRKDLGNRATAVEIPENEEVLADINDIDKTLERSSFANSVFVPRNIDLGSARYRDKFTKRNRYKAISAQVYHERQRLSVGGNSVDWRMVLEEMAKSTPEYSLKYIEDGIEINVDKDVLARILQATGDDKFGAIRRRTGATIKVSRDESTLLLSGTRQAINRATVEFRDIAGRIRVTRHYSPLDPGESKTEELGREKDFFIPPLSRDEGGFYDKQRLTWHVYSTPMPMEWTPKTLEDYVISLVDTYVDPPLHSSIYPHTRKVLFVDHERAITRRLLRLFSRLPSGAGFSCSVVKLALSYMTKKGDKYLPQVRGLFSMLDRRGITMDTDVFNILLEAPVKTRNLRKFRQTLLKMTRRGFAPNFDTWLLFLRMFDSIEVKSYILQAMNAKNMLGTPEAIQRIAQEMASQDTNHAVVQRKPLETFLQEQEDRYGPDWLTRDAGNKVLDALSSHGRYEDACKVLDIMSESYHRTPKTHVQERLAKRLNADSFIAIVNHAWIKGKMPLAINIVRKMKTRKFAKQPSPTILHLLFEIAWRTRLRTTVVVIWRYACLTRLTSYRMRKRVSSLLSGELSDADGRKLAASVYHQLGGEALAHDLVGGRKVLERIKTLCRRLWGEKYPRDKLGVIAAKVLPTAFEEFGPTVALGEVLCQSVLVDFKCLQARKMSRIRDLLATAKVKSIPLWQRLPGEERWVDLAQLDPTDPSTIKYDDVWAEEWESEGWTAKPRVWVPEDLRDQFEKVYRIWQAERAEQGDAEPVEVFARDVKIKANEGAAKDEDELQRMMAIEPRMEKRMAIINPLVWNDDKDDVLAIGGDYTTQLQRQNEESILNALEQVSKNYMSFRYVFAADNEGTPSGSDDWDHGEHRVAKDESDEVDSEAGDQDIRAEDRLERVQQILRELKEDSQGNSPVDETGEDARTKP